MNYSKLVRSCLSMALFGSLLCQGVSAHTPYLAPTSFDPVMGKMITLDASFAEQFFIPEAAFGNSEFVVTGPDGKQQAPDSLHQLKTRTVVEHELKEEGTYHISTGPRMGATFLIYEQDGEEKRSMNPTEPLPDNAQVKMHFQSVTQADTYVSQKKISKKAIKVGPSGLQIKPITHPNELFAGEDIKLQVVFEGKSLAGTELVVYPAKGADEVEAIKVTTDKKGRAKLQLEAGKYLLRARHRAPAPEGADVPTYSHTTTLSVLVYHND